MSSRSTATPPTLHSSSNLKSVLTDIFKKRNMAGEDFSTQQSAHQVPWLALAPHSSAQPDLTSKALSSSHSLSHSGVGEYRSAFWVNIVTDRVVKDRSKNAKYCEYVYRVLQHPKDIRVLELAPGSCDDPLRARLIHNSHLTSIKGHGKSGWEVEYEAVSYCWGSGSGWNSVFSIILDDEYSLNILPNLDAVLRRLRSPKIPRYAWVDALCINQYDVQEKSTQISLMLDVYAGAKNVQIWLGEGSKSSAIAMEALSYLAQKTPHKVAPWEQQQDYDISVALEELLGRAYFQRIWVVQEACVSQQAVMLCGSDSFQWENDPSQIMKFIRRIKYAAISPEWERAGLKHVNMDIFLQLLDLQMQHIERMRGEVLRPPPDILDIAYSTRHRMASDPRDKLFAIMGLVDQTGKAFFRPDYRMNVEEVFNELLRVVEI